MHAHVEPRPRSAPPPIFKGPRKTPKASPPKAKSVDPVFAAIEDYWEALEAWRRVNARYRRLEKRLPDDVKRDPRVQVGRVRERDKNGHTIVDANDEPVLFPRYVNSIWAAHREIRRLWDHHIGISAPQPQKWVRQTDGTYKPTPLPMTKELRDKRRKIFASRHKKLKEITAAFEADAKELVARQREAGWSQIVEEETAAHYRVVRSRYRVVTTKPTTVKGAAALAAFVDAARRSYSASAGKGPYGLGEYYPATICRNIAAFLQGGA